MLSQKLVKSCSALRRTTVRAIRNASSASIAGNRLVFDVYGDPVDVMRLERFAVDPPEKEQVVLETLAATVNPADVNTIQGVYAVKPSLPAVGGNEAVGRVLSVGPEVSSLPVEARLEPGDIVITRRTGLGAWTTHMRAAATAFYKMPIKNFIDDDQLASVATLSVNPCTAYRMLVDFNELTSGDVVVQNGANSAVGQAVIQIAKGMGLKTLNIVRDRPDFEEMRDFLTSLGADWVARDTDESGIKSLGLNGKCRLGLNCVSGKSGIQMLKLLAPQSNMVLYGGMSRQPLWVPVSFLIFKDIRVRGFWMTAWKAREEMDGGKSNKFHDMMQYLWKLVESGQLKPPRYKFAALEDFRTAISDAMPEGGRGDRKVIFKF